MLFTLSTFRRLFSYNSKLYKCYTAIGLTRSDAAHQLRDLHISQYSQHATLLGYYLVPCKQGSIPPVGVDARSEGKFQAAEKFAIWTHFMKQTVYNPAFVPEGAPGTAGNTYNSGLPFFFSYFQLLIITFVYLNCHFQSRCSMRVKPLVFC